jgi:hypothetical protein
MQNQTMSKAVHFNSTLKETHRNHFRSPLCSQTISGSGLIAEAIAICIKQQASSLTEALPSEDLKFTRASLGHPKRNKKR